MLGKYPLSIFNKYSKKSVTFTTLLAYIIKQGSRKLNRVGSLTIKLIKMKKLAILFVALSSLVLISFMPPPDGIKKIGANLWEISPKAKLSRADATALENIIKKEYNIKDFKTTVSLDFKGDARKGWWVLHQKWNADRFTESAITGDHDKPTKPIEAINLIHAILVKYTPDPKNDPK